MVGTCVIDLWVCQFCGHGRQRVGKCQTDRATIQFFPTVCSSKSWCWVWNHYRGVYTMFFAPGGPPFGATFGPCQVDTVFIFHYPSSATCCFPECLQESYASLVETEVQILSWTRPTHLFYDEFTGAKRFVPVVDRGLDRGSWRHRIFNAQEENFAEMFEVLQWQPSQWWMGPLLPQRPVPSQWERCFEWSLWAVEPSNLSFRFRLHIHNHIHIILAPSTRQSCAVAFYHPDER